MKEIKLEREIQGKKYTFKTGLLAKQANGSVMVSIEGTEVLGVSTMSKNKPSTDFFPLTVHYNERYYANGKIPGGYFKREGKLTDAEVLICRMIDRPLRPLFPAGFFNEVQVIPTVVSIDGINPSDIVGMIGASSALVVSDIPFRSPVGAVRVCYVDGKFVANPTYDEMKRSTMDLIVAGTDKAITMIEGDCQEYTEDFVVEAIEFAHEVIKEIVDFQMELRQKAGKEKVEVELFNKDSSLVEKLKDGFYADLEKALNSSDKVEREKNIGMIYDKAKEQYQGSGLDLEILSQIPDIIHDFEKDIIRNDILNNEKRSDGRKMNELRDIDCRVDVLNNVHGSALFTRGQTQSLGVATLSSFGESLSNESVSGEMKKNFFLHYNFPPYSVGEVGRLGGVGRREIGHGMLAERSLARVFPNEKEFPMSVRVVSEILESNGSSSMATICSGSMAMVRAGVPLKKIVAGIAMGLIMDGDRYQILTDIQGLEDHLGDMDFKVAGTKDGITGFQLDIKVEGITLEIMKKALYQAKDARLSILEKMEASLEENKNEEAGKNSPIMHSLKIPVDKIKLIIGPGGKNIKKIVETTSSQIDIEEDGTVKIFSKDDGVLKNTLVMIDEVLGVAKVNSIYNGTVRKITPFGAFIEIFSGTDGLLHISEISEERLEKVEDVLKESQKVKVKVISVDDRGRIGLSVKQI